MHWKGKHVLITGAAKRLGRAIAERLLPDGIHLTVHYGKSEKEARELVALVEKHGGKAHALPADLHKMSELEELAHKAISKFGPVQILVNSASVFYPTPLGQVKETEWDDLMTVNLKAQFFLSQACAKVLKEKKLGGVILNLVDVNARRTLPDFTPYQCSKGGLLTLTRNMARELAPLVRVNSISPGPVLLPENYSKEQRDRSENKTLLKRLGNPKDIAEAAAFLIGNEYITGQDLAVDGGRSLADALSE